MTCVLFSADAAFSTWAGAPMKRQLGNDDFAILESIRGLAALYVVLNHARGHAWAGYRWLQESGLWASLSPVEKVLSSLNQLTRLGHEAVILFFVLSGFSIAHSLRSSPAVGGFFVRRFLRLYPPKLVAIGWALVVFAITSAWTPGLFDPSRATWNLSTSTNFATAPVILRNLAYMPRGAFVVQFWSLPHEMLFYVLAPLIVPHPRVFLGVALLGYGIGSLPMVGASGNGNFFLAFGCRYLLYFAIGVGCYAFLDRIERGFESITKVMVGACVIGLFLALVALTLKTGTTRLTELLSVALALVLISAFLKWRWHGRLTSWLGRQSYSLYLTHVATIILGTALVMNICGSYAPVVTPYLWIGLVPLCLGVAELNFRIVEGPSRRWVAAFRGDSRRLRPQRGSASTATAGI
jgi:peptidoglycan/LPS O-acetylase OafA/YrhL